MKYIKALLFVILVSAFSGSLSAQDLPAAEVKRIVESQNFIFRAQTALPQTGRSQMLSSDYDLTVTKTMVTSYLLYFGRAYTASLSGEAGIKFTTTDFDYNLTKSSGDWAILIKPRDIPGVQKIHISIFDNGRATLDVTNTNRQSISYNGYIKEGKARLKAF